MKSRKILLFGGNGFLGSRLLQQFPPGNVASPTHQEVDLLKIADVYGYIASNAPDVIIYATGVTRIDPAEKDKKLAYSLNHKIPKQIAQFVSKMNIPFIYLSTDAVFDGYQNKYIFKETDIPKAKSTYGLSKLRGERAVLEASIKNVVLRLITLYGIDYERKNFITNTLQDLRDNKTILGIVDQIQNPLEVDIASLAITFVVNQQLHGIYHVGALDSSSNYDFLVTLANKFNLDDSLIKKTSFSKFMKNKIGHRKKKSILLCDKFTQVSQNKILKTTDASLEYLFDLNRKSF